MYVRGMESSRPYVIERLAVSRKTTVLALALSLVGLPMSTFAWGGVGHQIVCEIAFQELAGSIAHRELKDLIASDPYYRTFYQSCTWADRVRPERKLAHFVNVSRETQSIDFEGCPAVVQTCVLDAIVEDTQVLVSNADQRTKLQALKYLGHWVGDVHQPLHVSFKDDRGANFVHEIGPCKYEREWTDDVEEISLHAVWDTCLVEHNFGTDAARIGVEFWKDVTEEQRRGWRSVFDIDRIAAQVTQWADESYQITTQPEVRYCIWSERACEFAPGRRFYEGEIRYVDVDQAYLERHAQTVKLRLQQAGIRLANILEHTLQ